MLAHRERVVKITLQIYDENKEIFPDVNRAVLEELASDHDFSKLDENVAEKLFHDYYGKDFKNMGDAEKNSAIEFRSSFNRTDTDREHRIMRKNKIKNPLLMSLYFRLVKLADQLDRHFDPVAEEEFGRKLIPPSEMEKEDKLFVPLAKKYENRDWYLKHTQGSDFDSYKSKNPNPNLPSGCPTHAKVLALPP